MKAPHSFCLPEVQEAGSTASCCPLSSVSLLEILETEPPHLGLPYMNGSLAVSKGRVFSLSLLFSDCLL